MDQHPVPQNISSYEFHLVGDMTLKQFFQLAGGVLAGIVLYRLPLPFILKWPLIIVAVLVGILLAFVPISGRPFSQWLTAFIKAIYTPTQYIWNPNSTSPQPSPDFRRGGSTAVEGEVKKPSTPLDILEDQLFSRFSQLFSHPTAPIIPTPVITPPTITPIAKPTTLPTTPTLIPPSYPNLLSGVVVTPTGSSLEGVILEIMDAAKIPVRALRTNKLGQFQTATPLSPGTYVLSAEKEGFSFAPISFQAENQIINPILITAQT